MQKGVRYCEDKVKRQTFQKTPYLSASVVACLFDAIESPKRVCSSYTSYFAFVYANDDSVPLVDILLTLILCFVCLSNALLYIG